MFPVLINRLEIVPFNLGWIGNTLLDSYANVPVWHLEHWINSLFDSYACVPMCHLESGLIACLIAMLCDPVWYLSLD